MLASRTVRHAIDEVHIGILGNGNLHRADGEFLALAAGDLGTAAAATAAATAAAGALRDRSLNAFVLHKQDQSTSMKIE